MSVLVHQRTIRALGEDVLVQQSTIGALRRFCWNIKVLYERSGGCAGTAMYYRSTVAVLVQQGTIGAIRGAVMVQQSTIGALGMLCWYRRVR